MNSHLLKRYASRRANSPHHPFAKSLPVLLLLTLACLILFGSTAQAQTLCVNPPGNLPGLEAPPNWYNGAIVPPNVNEIRPVIDDPRWLSAVKIPYGDGAAEEVGFRALYGTVDFEGGKSFLFLSWNIHVDPSEQNTSDRLFVGLSGGGNALGLMIQPFNSSGCRNAAAPEAVTAYSLSGSTWTPTATPAWAATTTGKTGVWVTDGVITGGCPAADSWAVHMRVPLTDNFMPGASIGSSDFRMFYQIRMFLPDNTLLMKPYKWPRTAPDVTDLITGAEDFHIPGTDWGLFHLSTGPADTACTGAFGVSLDPYDVGTLNNYPGTSTPAPDLILYNATTPPTNTFFVRPLNRLAGGVTIPASRIKARVRVANWGSVATPGPWLDIPNGLAMAATHPAAIPSGMKGEINFPWQLTPADITTFATGPAGSDKCILVELSSAAGTPGDPDIVFLNDSVYRNMTFAPASKYTKEAEINVKGLSTTSAIGPKRDVYLYVQTLNMPAPQQRAGTTKILGRSSGLIKGVGPDQVRSLLDSFAAGKIGREEFDKVMPTYRVFVYHDTGERTTIQGVTYHQLEPQPSFGYYMVHDGDIEGWKHSLQGATEIAPNFYKIAVPTDGAVKVVTTIEAVEPGGTTTNFKRWGLSLHGGASIPHGNLNNVFNPGPNLGVDLEYRLTPTFSLEGIYTYHRFNGETFGGFTVPALNLHQFSANGKIYGNTSPVRPFFNFGGGAYVFTPGATTHGGLNLGGGLQFDVNPNFAVDGMYNYHNVFTSGSNTAFSTAQIGVRFRF